MYPRKGLEKKNQFLILQSLINRHRSSPVGMNCIKKKKNGKSSRGVLRRLVALPRQFLKKRIHLVRIFWYL